MKKFAMVFPGQGSQSKGMMADLANHYPLIENIYRQANEVLGYDLWQMTQDDPDNLLNQTEFTQPALLTAGYATWCVWRELDGAMPNWMAGHSLGEYTALVCSESLTFADGLALVAQRGRLMQAAVPPGIGAMAAIIGLSKQQIQEICHNAAQGQVANPANFNSNEQTVVSGHKEAVLRVIEAAKEQGAKIAKLLEVSVPSHCSLMQMAATQLALSLEKTEISMPKIPVIHNVSATFADNPQAIRDMLVKQLYSSVRWVDTIDYFIQHNVELVYECGPGKVLTGLMRRLNAEIQAVALNDNQVMQAQIIGVGVAC